MLKKFKVKNYKNFKDEIEIDFGRVAGYQFNKDCIINNTIGKMLVYGKNGTGKTNLGKAILDICNVLSDDRISDWQGSSLLNALAKENEISFYYEFLFDKKKVIFQYTKNAKSEIVRESLKIGSKWIFRMDYKKKRYIEENFKILGIETLNTNRFKDVLDRGYRGLAEKETSDLSFLRWILANSTVSETALNRLVEYSNNMYYLQTDVHDNFSYLLGMSFDYEEEQNNLKKLEKFLKLMGVNYELSYEELPDGEMELYFRFKNGKKISFDGNASSGTKSLVDLFSSLNFWLEKKEFLYIDEFDAFYHYELAEKLIEWIKMEYPKTQVIITTHNTNLMNNQLMRPDCLGILSSEGKLTALCDATERELREGHNLEKMYISGEFARYE